jgi:hypothetical protein
MIEKSLWLWRLILEMLLVYLLAGIHNLAVPTCIPPFCERAKFLLFQHSLNLIQTELNLEYCQGDRSDGELKQI